MTRLKIPSFQLGTVTLASCLSVASVRAINRMTSYHFGWLLFSAAAAENQRVGKTRRHFHFCFVSVACLSAVSVLTLYPAESWAPRLRAHEFAGVTPSEDPAASSDSC